MAHGFGREERVDCARRYGCCHAAAGVGNTDPYVVPGGQFQRPGLLVVEREIVALDVDGTAARHGVTCVDAQVEQGAFQLWRVDEGWPWPSQEAAVQANGWADGAANQFFHAKNQRRDVGRPRLQGLLAGEGQQPVDQGRGFLRRAAGQRQQWLKFCVTLLAQALLHQLLGIDDAAEQVVEVMGDATAELAHGLHFLRLAQRLLGLGQAPLLLNPVSDVVGKQISALHAAVMLTQGVETQFIVAWPEPADLGEPLPRQRPAPHRHDQVMVRRVAGQHRWQVFADFGCVAIQGVEVMFGLAVDCQPAQLGIDHMHVEQAVLDQFGKPAAFGQGCADPLFEFGVQPLQGHFGLASLGDVSEQHRDLAALGRLHTEGDHRQHTAGGDQLLLELQRFARAQYRTVAGDPVVRLVGHHLAQLLPDDVGDAGMLGVGGVGEDMHIVAERAMGAVEEFDDAKTFIHGVEQEAIDACVLMFVVLQQL